MYKKTIGLIVLLLTTAVSFSQFSYDKENTISECDCNTQLDEMYIKIPAVDLNAYDRIGIRIYDAEKSSVLAGELYTSGEFSSLNGGYINLLNPAELGEQDIMGIERGLFRGQHINLSYNSLCKYRKNYQVEFNIIGIKQVGTETTYEVTGNRVTARSKRIFDSGTIIYTSEKLKVKANPSTKEKNVHLFAYPIYFGGIAAGMAMIPVVNLLF